MALNNYQDADFSPSIEPSNVRPNMGTYNTPQSFRFWCQKVLPLVYDDSLSYYELLCKVVDYLNKTMEDVNTAVEDVANLNNAFGSLENHVNASETALLQAYNDLQDYVNTYFNNLDVQEEINNKLDAMAEDGTLDTLLLPYFNEYVADANEQIQQFKTDVTDSMNARINAQNTVIEGQTQRVNTLHNEFNAILQAQTSGDLPDMAEVVDARVGSDGINYSTLGDAIRYQTLNLKANGLENDNNTKAIIGYNNSFKFVWEMGNLALSSGAEEIQKFAIRTKLYKFNAPTVIHLLSNTTYRTSILKYDASGVFVSYFESSSADYTYTITGADLDYQYRFRIMRRDLAQISQQDANGMITYNPQNFINMSSLAPIITNLNGTVVDTLNADTAFTTGFYRVRTLTGTLPDGSASASNKCLVVLSFDGWDAQYLFDLFDPETLYTRVIRESAPEYSWKSLSHANYALSQGANINTITKPGYYSINSPTGTLPEDWDATKSYALLVWGSGEQVTGQPRFIVQCLLELFTTKIAIRQIDAYYSTIFDWSIIGNNGESALSMRGKKIVCFGDSITGNFRPPNDYPTTLANFTGATVYNAGFGGCCMSDNGQARRAYSMCRLADSIASGDWSLQENSGVVIDYATVSQDGTRYVGTGIDYVADRLAMLEAIDWTDIDYITIAYGTNDWSSDYSLDNANNLYDTTTYLGALRYSIEKILTAYPNIKVIPITPIWRWWDTGTGAGTYGDSDTTANRVSGYKLSEFADGVLNVSHDTYHTKAIDLYYCSEFNKFNRYQYFFTNDGTHPKPYGIEAIGVKISNEIMCGISR